MHSVLLTVLGIIIVVEPIVVILGSTTLLVILSKHSRFAGLLSPIARIVMIRENNITMTTINMLFTITTF